MKSILNSVFHRGAQQKAEARQQLSQSLQLDKTERNNTPKLETESKPPGSRKLGMLQSELQVLCLGQLFPPEQKVSRYSLNYKPHELLLCPALA